MKHYGDITKIDGHFVPIVDVVCGGSPCQDLSIAGGRKGLQGERSGLFMEQVRIVKEMRDECERRLRLRGANVDAGCIRPRYLIWENVDGARSSGDPKGEDFRIVLEEICKIADENATVPRLEGGQRWEKCGCIMGDGFSVAWRLHDAQFHGVPQRRRRLCVLADFNGDTAPRMVFELFRKTVQTDTNQAVGDIGAESRSEIQSQCESLSGHTQTSGEEGQGASANIERSTDKAISFLERSGKPGGGKGILIQEEKTGTLSTLNNQSVVQGINGNVTAPIDASYYKGCGERAGIEREVVCYGISPMDSNAMKSQNPHSGIYEAETTRTLDLNGGNPACNQGGMMVLEGNGCSWDGKQIAPTLTANNAGGGQRMPDKENFNAVIQEITGGRLWHPDMASKAHKKP